MPFISPAPRPFSFYRPQRSLEASDRSIDGDQPGPGFPLHPHECLHSTIRHPARRASREQHSVTRGDDRADSGPACRPHWRVPRSRHRAPCLICMTSPLHKLSAVTMTTSWPSRGRPRMGPGTGGGAGGAVAPPTLRPEGRRPSHFDGKIHFKNSQKVFFCLA